MKKEIPLTNLYFHDSKVVEHMLNNSNLTIAFENVLNLIDNSILETVEIKFVGVSVFRIKIDYGNNNKSSMKNPEIQNFAEILDNNPYVYELVKLESRDNYYEIFLSIGLDDGSPMIYFIFQDYHVSF